MLTNQTTPFVKEASDAFTIGEKVSGLIIIGISPDLININKTTRLAAEIKYNGIAVDSSLILNAELFVEMLNGTNQTYNTSNGLQVDDGIVYVDGVYMEIAGASGTTAPDAWMSAKNIDNRNDIQSTSQATENYLNYIWYRNIE